MKEMTVHDILIDWLKAHGCEGLCHGDCDCGCHFDNFIPCAEADFDCVAAVTGPVPSDAEFEADHWMTPKQFADEPKGEPE